MAFWPANIASLLLHKIHQVFPKATYQQTLSVCPSLPLFVWYALSFAHDLLIPSRTLARTETEGKLLIRAVSNLADVNENTDMSVRIAKRSNSVMQSIWTHLV